MKNRRGLTALVLAFLMVAGTYVIASSAFAGTRERGYEQREQVMHLRGVIDKHGNLVTPSGQVFRISDETKAGQDLKKDVGEYVDIKGYVPIVSSYYPPTSEPIVRVTEYRPAKEWEQPGAKKGEAGVYPPGPAYSVERKYGQRAYYGHEVQMLGTINPNREFIAQNGQAYFISPYTDAGQAVMGKEGQSVQVTGTVQATGPNMKPVITVQSFTTP